MLHKNFECHLFLIRHGESTANHAPQNIGGDLNCSLSERGKLQAQAIGKELRARRSMWTRIYASTLPRAFETAKIASQQLSFPENQIQQTPALVEQFQGDWNQKERKTVYTPEIRAMLGTKNSWLVPPNGESLRMVERRVSNWLEDEILYNRTFIEQYPKAGIALFTHGMTIRCLIRFIFQSDPSLTWKIKVFNGSISWVVFKSDGWHPYSLNEVAHLKEIGFLPY